MQRAVVVPTRWRGALGNDALGETLLTMVLDVDESLRVCCMDFSDVISRLRATCMYPLSTPISGRMRNSQSLKTARFPEKRPSEDLARAESRRAQRAESALVTTSQPQPDLRDGGP